MDNIMVDLETLGNTPTAAIVSIGAVAFDPVNFVIGKTFYEVIDLKDAARHGTIDPETVTWWIGQQPEAQEVFNIANPYKRTLFDALHDLTRFINIQSEYPKIWGNGSSFDNVILRNAYNSTGQTVPWKFYNDRDLRTIKDLALMMNIDSKELVKAEGTKHNALDDAIFQAKQLNIIFHQILNKIEGKEGFKCCFGSFLADKTADTARNSRKI